MTTAPAPLPPGAPLPGPAEFTALADLIRAQARVRPRAAALVDEQEQIDYAELDHWADRVAAWLQRQGIQPGQAVALSAANGVAAAVAFIGTLRMGAVVVPLPTSASTGSWTGMLRDAQARCLFADGAGLLAAVDGLAVLDCSTLSSLHDALTGPPAAQPAAWQARPEDPFNIIYSSGTTGQPKGIVQSHGMRWAHVRRGQAYGYGPQSRTLLSTPLYSNTTLVAFVPALAMGGCVHLMGRFDPENWLLRAQRERITHTMLVPVQFRRLLEHADFDRTDLSAFETKFCTSAPFPAALKAEVLRRWPGGLIEVYGMTEGGGACILEAHRHPDKLHTVGQPGPGHDIRLIDEEGHELPGGQATGEIVGRSPGMMTGYHGRPDLTRQALWHDAQGRAYIRTGDVGRFDEDGFLVLMDRRKDLVISGGFNVYPSDLEALLRQHPAVADAAVVGVPSRRWGETPVAWVVRCKPGTAHAPHAPPDAAELRAWVNARCGKLQRLAGLAYTDELPRSAIGKVLKRELREQWTDPVE